MLIRFSFIVSILLSALSAFAEDDVPAAVFEGDAGIAPGAAEEVAMEQVAKGPPRRPWGFSLGVKTHGVLDSSLDDGGRMGFSRHALSMGVSRRFPEGRFAALSFDQEWARYDFSGEENKELSDGFQDVNTTQFALSFRSPINDLWSVFGSANITFSVARGVALTDGKHYGGMASFRRKVNDRFAWSVAVVAVQRLEEDVLVMAFPGVDWSITERLKLTTKQGYVLSYDFGEKGHWIADTSLLIERREFKPDPDGTLADDVVKDWRFPLEAGLSYRPHPGMLLRGYVGVLAYQRFTIVRDDGTTISPKTDPAPFAGLQADLRF